MSTPAVAYGWAVRFLEKDGWFNIVEYCAKMPTVYESDEIAVKSVKDELFVDEFPDWLELVRVAITIVEQR